MRYQVPKIDMHVHAVPEHDLPKVTGRYYVLPEELRAIYDAHGIEKGVLLCYGASPECCSDRLSMREARQMTVDSPDTIGWWFCGVDPRSGRNGTNTDFVPVLEYYKSRGARGVGEVTCNLPITDERVMNLLSACEKVHLPVTLHFGGVKGDMGVIDDIGLPGLEKVLTAFPKLTALGHSARFWAELGDGVTEENRAGFPTGRIEKEGRVAALLRAHQNLWCDLSSVSGYRAMVRDPEYTYRFWEEFQDRIVFATDISEPEHAQSDMMNLSEMLDDAVNEGRISQAAYRKICRENALRLLNGTF